MSYSSGSHRSNCPWNRSSSTYGSSDQVYQTISSITHSVGSKRSYSPDLYGSSYQSSSPSAKLKSTHGYVTRLYESWGVIDNEIQFSFSACTKGIPKMDEFVTVEASYSPNTTYKWRATKVQILSNGRDYSNLKPILSSRTESDDVKRSRGSARSRERSRDRSRDRRYDDGDRKRFKRDDRDEKPRESEKHLHREKEKFKDYEKPPAVKRSRSPVKRRYVRYAVKVPAEYLTLTKSDVITLKKRYPALYIPSDFFSSTFNWSKSFPLTQPYTLDKPCSFHIMHKDCDPCVKNDAVLDPPDLDYIFSAKVMLMGLPNLDDVYKKTICRAEDLHKEDEKSYSHLSRLIQFLVGSRGKGEPVAIGGPWSPSLDGANPEKDSAVLVRTAIRTCKALTGIDLATCSRWYRFMELYYHRSESVHKGKTIPARVETVVFFLPEVWNCVPTCLEWDTIILDYKKLAEEKLRPKATDESTIPSVPSDQAEESDKEEDLVVIDKCEEKVEPTHYSELDPQNMKVNDIRQELEARSLSTKGLKPQLVQRLELALRKEKDAEAESSSDSTFISKIMAKDGEKENETNEIDIKMDEDMKVVDELKGEDSAASDELMSEQSKKENVQADTVKIDRVTIERKYTLPETPHIIVHPSRTAKSGKFDCSLMSLASLLDYRANDNRRHAFELYLFAELFHEMLQRDFGFSIYKTLCEAPEKAKEEKAEKEPKKMDKDQKSESVDDGAKTEDKDENETKDESTDEVKEEPDKEKPESGDVKAENGTKVEESKKKDRVKLITKDPSLLLAFLFFDRSRCGYIFDKDLESLLLSLGLQLSRHQVKKLINKVSMRETVHYRKLTDKPETEEETSATNCDLADIALGNNKYLPVFLNGEIAEDDPNLPPWKKSRKGDCEVSKITGLVNVGGSVVDVEQITTTLKKNETARLEIEKQLLKYKKDNDALKESLKRSQEKEKKINEDLRSCRDRLMTANKDRVSLSHKSKTYFKTLMNIKDQISSLEPKSDRSSRKKSTSERNEDKSTSKTKKPSNDSTAEKPEMKEESNPAQDQDTAKEVESVNASQDSADVIEEDGTKVDSTENAETEA